MIGERYGVRRSLVLGVGGPALRRNNLPPVHEPALREGSSPAAWRRRSLGASRSCPNHAIGVKRKISLARPLRACLDQEVRKNRMSLFFQVLHGIVGTNGYGFRRFASGVWRIGATSMEGRCTPPSDAQSRKRTPRSRSSRRPQSDKLTRRDRFGRAAPMVPMIPIIP